MGSLLENEDPFILSGGKGKLGRIRDLKPKKDETLYDL
jgi:hypothetical protein